MTTEKLLPKRFVGSVGGFSHSRERTAALPWSSLVIKPHHLNHPHHLNDVSPGLLQFGAVPHHEPSSTAALHRGAARAKAAQPKPCTSGCPAQGSGTTLPLGALPVEGAWCLRRVWG